MSCRHQQLIPLLKGEGDPAAARVQGRNITVKVDAQTLEDHTLQKHGKGVIFLPSLEQSISSERSTYRQIFVHTSEMNIHKCFITEQ